MICHCLVLRLPCKEIAPVTMCTERGRCHFCPGWLVACYHQCGSETWPNLAMPLFHFRLQANDRIYRLVPAPHNSVWHAWVFQWVYAPSKLAAFCPKSNVRKHQTSSNIIKHHQPSSTIINHHQPSISWTIHNFYKLRVHWFTPPLAISYHPNATMCHFQDPRGGLAAHHVRDQQLHFGPGLLVPGTGLFDRGEVPGKQISPGTSPWQPKMRVLVCEHAELIDHDLSNIYQIGFVSGKLMGYAKNMQVSWWTGWSTMQFWDSQFWDNPIYGEKIWDMAQSLPIFLQTHAFHTIFCTHGMSIPTDQLLDLPPKWRGTKRPAVCRCWWPIFGPWSMWMKTSSGKGERPFPSTIEQTRRILEMFTWINYRFQFHCFNYRFSIPSKFLTIQWITQIWMVKCHCFI